VKVPPPEAAPHVVPGPSTAAAAGAAGRVGETGYCVAVVHPNANRGGGTNHHLEDITIRSCRLNVRRPNDDDTSLAIGAAITRNASIAIGPSE
jgi:hypothetical protein